MMKNHLVLFIGLLFLALTSCREKERVTVFIPVDWQQRVMPHGVKRQKK
jgi:hypothetical protein